MVRLIRANQLSGYEINGEPVRDLKGDVHIIRDQVNLYCDEMIEYSVKRRVEAFGNVKIVSDKRIIFADKSIFLPDQDYIYFEGNVKIFEDTDSIFSEKGEYYINTERANLWKNVKLIDQESNIVTSDSLYHERNTGYNEFHRTVSIFSPSDQTLITGEKARFFTKEQIGIIDDNPQLIKFPESEYEDTLFLKSSFLVSNQNPEINRFYAVGNVRMVQSDLSSVSDSMIYLRNEKIFRLFHNPVVWYDVNQVSGDSIYIFLQGNELSRLMCFRQSFSISEKVETYKWYNQLKGDQITYQFYDGEINSIFVNQMAQSIYYLDDEGKIDGANLISGDSLRVSFIEGEIDQIRVYGGVEGKYLPVNEVIKAPVLLKGFKWQSINRPRIIEFSQNPEK